jgi:photosystem II stability/assembly factor-like uncharacterized protein
MTLGLSMVSAGTPHAARPAVGGTFSWQNPLPQGNTLLDVAAAGRADLCAVGGAGTIVRSSDGGVTWAAQTSGTSEWLTGASFATSACGWAVGRPGTVVHTGDGGAILVR